MGNVPGLRLWILGAVLCLSAGCGGKSSPVAGTWKDTSLDGLSSLSAQDKERMRATLTLTPDGTGTYATGGSRAAARVQTSPRTDPIRWKLDGARVVLTGAKGGAQEFVLSADGRTLSLAGDSRLTFLKQ